MLQSSTSQPYNLSHRSRAGNSRNVRNARNAQTAQNAQMCHGTARKRTSTPFRTGRGGARSSAALARRTFKMPPQRMYTSRSRCSVCGGLQGVQQPQSTRPEKKASGARSCVAFARCSSGCHHARMHSQEIKVLRGKTESIEIQFELANFEEITGWVLSWGAQAEVLAPKALRDRVSRELRRAARKY